jgi:hypothetical protein
VLWTRPKCSDGSVEKEASESNKVQPRYRGR